MRNSDAVVGSVALSSGLPQGKASGTSAKFLNGLDKLSQILVDIAR